MARVNALEQYVIDNISVPDYFNRFLADKSKGIMELHEETSTATICPFHDDVNPSFRYWKPKRFFMCFGCGVAGDVINLHRLTLQRKLKTKVARETALKDLCRIYNIQYKRHPSSKSKQAEETESLPGDPPSIVEEISVFDRCRKSIHLMEDLREHRKHFTLTSFKQQNDRIKNNTDLTLEEQFRAFEDLDFKAGVAINATDDHFDIVESPVYDITREE